MQGGGGGSLQGACGAPVVWQALPATACLHTSSLRAGKPSRQQHGQFRAWPISVKPTQLPSAGLPLQVHLRALDGAAVGAAEGGVHHRQGLPAVRHRGGDATLIRQRAWNANLLGSRERNTMDPCPPAHTQLHTLPRPRAETGRCQAHLLSPPAGMAPHEPGPLWTTPPSQRRTWDA